MATKAAENEEIFVEQIGRKKFWEVLIIVYAVLLFGALVFSFFPLHIGEKEWNVGISLFSAILTYTIIGCLQSVGSTQVGARYFINKPIDEVPSGFVFVPPLFCTLEKDPRNLIQAELPDNPEKIFHAPKEGWDGIVPPGKKPPIRIAFGPYDKNQGIPVDDPFNVQMTAEVVPVIVYQIRTGSYIQFRAVVGNRENAEQIMEDTTVAFFNDALSKVTPAVVKKDTDKYNKELKNAIEIRTANWGIDLKSTEIKAINYSHTYNEKILDIPKARINAQASIIAAKANKEALTREGEGKGAAEKAILNGRTAGLEDMKVKLSLKGSEVLAAETARGITNNPGQKTVVAGAGGFRDLAMVGSVLGDALSTGKEVKNA